VPSAFQSLPFDPTDAKAALAQLPTRPAVFALYGAEAHAEPYIGRTPNLRGRLERLLQPSAKHPRRLQLAGRVRRIEWKPTASEFESLLAQFSLLAQVYGPKSLERMHLGAPAFVRYLGGNPYPRLTVTNRPSQREAEWAYGPFASRAAAERFAEEALKLFLLRRCTDDLHPDPSHPGCVYSEMKMCLAPCYKGCSDERYGEESSAVERFLATRGESRLVTLRTQRDEASANLEFESAAGLHAQVLKVEVVRALAPELVRPLSQLRAVILQAAAEPDEVAVFLFENGRLRGPAAFSTVGMRIQNEQSGSSSLFAQPMALEPIPENAGISHPSKQKALAGDPGREQGTGISWSQAETEAVAEVLAPEGASAGMVPLRAEQGGTSALARKTHRGMLEARMEDVLAKLGSDSVALSSTLRQGHLALLKRWYYRPETRRTGEICFPDSDGNWPVKGMLRSVGRIAGKALAAPSQPA
jgi:excinuclease ABC subunit C